MQRSTDRVLTTHAGSLPRSARLLQMLVDREAGHEVDEAAFEKQVGRDLDEVLQKQHAVGVDIVCDGELPRQVRAVRERREAVAEILDVGRGVGRNALVQRRLVIQTGKQRHLLGQGHRQPVHLHRVQPRERGERVEELATRQAVMTERRRSLRRHEPTIAHGVSGLSGPRNPMGGPVSEYLVL